MMGSLPYLLIWSRFWRTFRVWC